MVEEEAAAEILFVERLRCLDSCVAEMIGDNYARLVSLMAEITATTAEACGFWKGLEPRRLDELTRNCASVRHLTGVDPSLTYSPMRRDRQEWVGASRNAASADPSKTLLMSGRGAEPLHEGPGGKPGGPILFTSTASLPDKGMWRWFLDPYDDVIGFPKPWSLWRLRATKSSSCVNITGASDWVMFVERFPRPSHEWIGVDWEEVRRVYSAVHISWSTVVATQGISFECRYGVTQPVYWDVESTVWLQWVFDRVNFVQSF